jgi:hypothetical protein
VRLLVLSALVVVVLVPAAILLRRSERGRARLDRQGLDDLRRIYRRDNPRGPGLEPLIRDQQRRAVDPEEKDG